MMASIQASVGDLGLILLVGLFALGKWLVENAGKSGSAKNTETADPPPRRMSRPVPSAAQSDEERVRRFMEALGLPADGAPPPKVAPPLPSEAAPVSPPDPWRMAVERAEPARQGPPPTPAQRPPMRGRAAREPRSERKRIAPAMEPVAPMQAIGKAAAMSQTASQMEVQSIPDIDFGSPVEQAEAAVDAAGREECRPSGPAKPPAACASVRTQLREPTMLRKALILREILGPPKALQSAKGPSIFAPL